MNTEAGNEQSEDYATVDDDVLLSLVPLGGKIDQAHGPVTAHVGWGVSLMETYGIEDIIGIAGFGSEVEFKDWVDACVGLPLVDWEGCSLQLYKCWMPCLHEQVPERHAQTAGSKPGDFFEDQFSYVV